MLNETITLLGSTIIGSVVKIWAQKQEYQKHLVDLAVRQQEAADESADKAATRAGSGGAITRRIIVCVVLFTVFLAPVIIATCFPATPVFFAYAEQGTGFWASIMSSAERMKFVRVDGFTILPIHTQLASAIAGFYFGAGVVKAK